MAWTDAWVGAWLGNWTGGESQGAVTHTGNGAAQIPSLVVAGSGTHHAAVDPPIHVGLRTSSFYGFNRVRPPAPLPPPRRHVGSGNTQLPAISCAGTGQLHHPAAAASAAIAPASIAARGTIRRVGRGAAHAPASVVSLRAVTRPAEKPRFTDTANGRINITSGHRRTLLPREVAARRRADDDCAALTLLLLLEN